MPSAWSVALAAAGFEVGLVNPRRIKAFREFEGRRAKTDRLDARLIARFALAMTDAIRPLPTAEQLALRALSTRRRQLTEMIAMEKTGLNKLPSPSCWTATVPPLPLSARNASTSKPS